MGFFDKFRKNKAADVQPTQQPQPTQPSEAAAKSQEAPKQANSEVVRMSSIPYTIQSGFHGWGSVMPYGTAGGISALNQVEKLHDYEKYSDYPGLSEFLDKLTFVDGDYPGYYTTSADTMNFLFLNYITRFSPNKENWSFQSLISDSLIMHIQEYGPDINNYQDDIILGSEYFNFIFYKLAWMVAINAIPEDLIDTIIRDCGPTQLEDYKRFVNEFDHFSKCTFVFDLPDGQFHAEHRANGVEERAKGPIYHCSKGDFEKYLRPYTLFLSNFTLILAVTLAANIFGQCAFTIGWEDSVFPTDLPRECWPHPRRS